MTDVVSLGRENGHITVVVSLMEVRMIMLQGGGYFKGGRMVMLKRWSLLEAEWSCYRSGH